MKIKKVITKKFEFDNNEKEIINDFLKIIDDMSEKCSDVIRCENCPFDSMCHLEFTDANVIEQIFNVYFTRDVNYEEEC